jgi:sporulation protein YlmC with PRC-barrel domain
MPEGKHFASTPQEIEMKSLIAMTAGLLIVSAPALAQGAASGRPEMLPSIPSNSVTVTDWYKQNVYDSSDNKIGEIMDVLVAPEGRATTLIIGVGGFLGAGEKDVAVPFTAVKHTVKDRKIYLTIDTTKDALKAAPGFKYDRQTTTWAPEAK